MAFVLALLLAVGGLPADALAEAAGETALAEEAQSPEAQSPEDAGALAAGTTEEATSLAGGEDMPTAVADESQDLSADIAPVDVDASDDDALEADDATESALVSDEQDDLAFEDSSPILADEVQGALEEDEADAIQDAEDSDPQSALTAQSTTTIPVSQLSVGSIAKQTYTGSYLYPNVTIRHGTTTLTRYTDYYLSYANNRDAGTATVTITGAGNYTGTRTVNFQIAKAASTIKLKAQTRYYTGEPVAFAPWYSPESSYAGQVSYLTKTGSAGAVTYKYYKDSACKKQVKAANVKKAGTYYVRATVAADANYKAATSKAVKFVIKKQKAFAIDVHNLRSEACTHGNVVFSKAECTMSTVSVVASWEVPAIKAAKSSKPSVVKATFHADAYADLTSYVTLTPQKAGTAKVTFTDKLGRTKTIKVTVKKDYFAANIEANTWASVNRNSYEATVHSVPKAQITLEIGGDTYTQTADASGSAKIWLRSKYKYGLSYSVTAKTSKAQATVTGTVSKYSTGICWDTFWSCKKYVPVKVTNVEAGDVVKFTAYRTSCAGGGYETATFYFNSSFSSYKITFYMQYAMRNYRSFSVTVTDRYGQQMAYKYNTITWS